MLSGDSPNANAILAPRWSGHVTALRTRFPECHCGLVATMLRSKWSKANILLWYPMTMAGTSLVSSNVQSCCGTHSSVPTVPTVGALTTHSLPMMKTDPSWYDSTGSTVRVLHSTVPSVPSVALYRIEDPAVRAAHHTP